MVIRILLPYLLFWNVFSVDAQINKFTISTGGTATVNNFDWSVAGNPQGKPPNILSELTFKNILSFGYFMEGSYSPTDLLEIKVYFQRSQVVSGKGTDIDYNDDNRTNPTFEQNFISNKGILNVFKTGIQTNLLKSKKITLSPTIFYVASAHLFFILSSENLDLKSTYEANSKGAEIALTSKMVITKKITTSLSFDCHFIKYNAEQTGP